MSRSKLADVHVSHGEPRLAAVRARALKPLPSRAAKAPPRARKRPYRDLRCSLFAQARTEAARRLGGDAPEVARTALQLYRAEVRELGAIGPSAIAATWSWALLAACAHTLALRAAGATLDSDRGLDLLDRAARAQGHASRAWTAAAVAVGFVPSQRGELPPAAPWLEPADDSEGSR